MVKVKLFVKLIFYQFVVDSNLFLWVFFTPFESSESFGFWKTVNMNELWCCWIDAIVKFLILVSDFSKNFFFLLFVSIINNVFLIFKSLKCIVQSQQLISGFFMKSFSFSKWSWLSFLDVLFNWFDYFSCIIFIIFNFSEFLLFELLNVLTGIFINLFDVIIVCCLLLFK